MSSPNDTEMRAVKAPLVSIGVAVYNAQSHLSYLLESLASQSYPYLEIIVSDNASDDRTCEIAEAWCARDSRFRYVRNEHNIGALDNFNRVAGLASGEFFMWAAADDRFANNYVESCLAALRENEEVVLAGSKTAQFYHDADTCLFTDAGIDLVSDSVVDRFKAYRRELRNRFHVGMIFYGLHRRSALEKSLPLKSVVGSDHVHIVSMLLQGKVTTLDRTLAWKRVGGASRSYKEILKSMNRSSKALLIAPLLDRELEFQRQILHCPLPGTERIRLAVWSWFYFLIFDFLLRSRTGQKMSLLKKIGLKGTIRLALYHLASQRRPFSRGYYDHKNLFLERSLNDPALIARFVDRSSLGERYGYRLDERVVEYPWVISKLKADDKTVFDAGSALNFPFVLESMIMNERKFVICTLSPEEEYFKSHRVSYLYNDLRSTMMKDASFDVVTCISTIEHVGLDNTRLYSGDTQYLEEKFDDYLKVIVEMKRLLKPGGKLLLTVPYGKYQNFGWLQQFNRQMVESVIKTFDGSNSSVDYFRYENDGWHFSERKKCDADEYFDFHSAKAFTEDMLAAARSVACLELVK